MKENNQKESTINNFEVDKFNIETKTKFLQIIQTSKDSFALATLKGLFMIGGGACIAIIAYFGQIAGNKELIGIFSSSLVSFAYSCCATIISMIFAYFSYEPIFLIMNDAQIKWHKIAKIACFIFHLLSIIAGFIALCFIFKGIYFASDGLANYYTSK